MGLIESPYFTAGVTFDEDFHFCIKAAPIIKYMVGWTSRDVEHFCMKKQWKYKVVE